MARINEHYLKLKAGYLFPEIGRRVKAFAAEHSDAKIIRMGIGDVTEPLPAACVEAMHKAVDDMATRAGLHGYGPEQGYDWLREAIARNDYASRGCDISADEIFVSDGSKCDCGNILDILGPGNTIAMTDPVYPVYVDTNVMQGNTGPAGDTGEYSGLLYMRHRREQLHAGDPIAEGRRDLSLLSQQSHRRGDLAGAFDRMGELRTIPQRADPLRCSVRSVYRGCIDSAFDLRNPRRARGRDRISQFQ